MLVVLPQLLVELVGLLPLQTLLNAYPTHQVQSHEEYPAADQLGKERERF